MSKSLRAAAAVGQYTTKPIIPLGSAFTVCFSKTAVRTGLPDQRASHAPKTTKQLNPPPPARRHSPRARQGQRRHSASESLVNPSLKLTASYLLSWLPRSPSLLPEGLHVRMNSPIHVLFPPVRSPAL